MSVHIPIALLTELSQRIEAWMGLFYPPDRWPDLVRKLQAAAPAFGCEDAESCARLLTVSSTPKQWIELLATHLTVGETYFFREPRSFEVLEKEILPELLRERRSGNRRLRAWSAACCTGEEPYSLAILFHRLLSDLPTWDARILATDLSPQFLRKAVEGVYGQWSFRSVPPAIREQYFQKIANNRYGIRVALKQLVSFFQLNLVDESYPSSATSTIGMDVVFCRNVLIYFTPQRIKHILTRLYLALNDGGWLIVSPVETAFVMDSPFTAVQFPGATLFRKETGKNNDSFIFLPASSCFPKESTPLSPLPYIKAHDGTVATSFSYARTDPCQERDVIPGQSTSPLCADHWRQLYEEASGFLAHGCYSEVVETLKDFPWGETNGNTPVNPLREQIMVLLARAHANQGELREAREWCERALFVSKFEPRLYYLYATILLANGQEAEAHLSLTQALYLDPRFVLAHFTLGNLARQRKDFKAADKHFAKAFNLLQRHRPEDILPESEGMTAGRLARIIEEMSNGK